MSISSRPLPDWRLANLKQMAIQNAAPIFPSKPFINEIVYELLETPGREWEWVGLLYHALDPDPNAHLPTEKDHTLEKRVEVVSAVLLDKTTKFSFRDILKREGWEISWQQRALCLLARTWKWSQVFDIFMESGFGDIARQHELWKILPLMRSLVDSGQADPVWRIVQKFDFINPNMHGGKHCDDYLIFLRSLARQCWNLHVQESLQYFSPEIGYNDQGICPTPESVSMMRAEEPSIARNTTVMRVPYEVMSILEGLTHADYKAVCAKTETPFQLIERIIEKAEKKEQRPN